MTDQIVRRPSFTTFPEAPVEEAGVVAVLFTKDVGGHIHTYVKEYPGHHAPDPEIVAALTQAVEIAQL